MRILALNPYHGGSHKQFLHDWRTRSQHEFVVLSLPPRHLKWRMRQAAVGFARDLEELGSAQNKFDLIWTTSLCNVAELRGLLPESHRTLPLCVYFHENQITYPTRSQERDRASDWDINLPINNWTSALAADQVWFNSKYNLQSFLEGTKTLLKKMPDEKSLWTLEAISSRSKVFMPGVDLDFFYPNKGSRAGALTITWVGRWEHDKRPDLFFDALEKLKAAQIPFQLICLGQHFRQIPAPFLDANKQLASRIKHFGYCDDRKQYRRLLQQSDVVVSTADHEFFGLALLEAVACGAWPLVPDQLVYPELYGKEFRYGGSTDAERIAALCSRLEEWAVDLPMRRSLDSEPLPTQIKLDDLDWKVRAAILDRAATSAAPCRSV